MSGGPVPGDRAPLQRARERAAEALGEAYSADELSLAEFEERVDRCYRVATVRELEALFEDLPVSPRLPAAVGEEVPEPAGGSEVEPRRPATGDVPVRRREHDVVVGVMSGVGRKGAWTPAERTYALAVMGGAELDFREARFPPGATKVYVLAFWGGVEIVVPPGLRVESSGLPIMGGFDRLDQDGDGSRAPDAVLQIHGLACMGGVEVRVAGPDEESRRRRRG